MKKYTTLFLKHEFLILNVSLISFLLFVIIVSPLYPSDEILFLSSDSLTYYGAGSEFFDFLKQGYSWTRPFLYSGFFYYAHTLGGVWLIVIIQSILWVISGNLIFYSIKNISKRIYVRIVAISIFAFNLSLISYIFHGLTEVLSIAFLSAITYWISKSIEKGLCVRHTLYIILFFALLTVTKPLFLYPFVLSLLIGVIFHRKSFFANPKFALQLIIFISPILLQYTAMYSKYGQFKISAIGELTFNKYILAQGIREIENIKDVEESQSIALKMTREQKNDYLWKHRDTYVHLYFKNLKNNITGNGKNIILPDSYYYKRFTHFMIHYNNTHFVVFIVFLILFIGLFFIDLFSRKLLHYWQQTVLGLLLYYIIFSSSISFWQADRLVLVSLPLWICLYTVILIRIGKIVHQKFLQQKTTSKPN